MRSFLAALTLSLSFAWAVTAEETPARGGRHGLDRNRANIWLDK